MTNTDMPPETSARARLADGVVIFDGAMGTMLYAAGVSLDRCLPELNASRPSLVTSIHRAYLASGVDVIETNTFGANRIALERFGLGDSVARFNHLAVELARDARVELASDALIAGSIGPSVAPVRSGDPVDRAGVEAILEQVAVLEESGVDLLVFETFSDLAALEAILAELDKRSHVPTVAQMTFVEDGNTISGNTPAAVASRLSNFGVAAIGASCTLGPRASRPIVEALVSGTTLPVLIQPNAGPPVIVDGRFEYRRNEEYFATTAQTFIELGATLVGGCCGTTPQHTEAMVRVIRSDPGSALRATSGPTVLIDRDRAPSTGLGVALATRPFAVVGTLITPDAESADEAVDSAAMIIDSGADAIIVRSTSHSRTSMNPISFGLLLQNRLGIEAALAIATFDKSLLGLQADLLGAHAFGLKTVICRTGTPPPRGDYPELRRIFDADAVDLIAALRGLNGSGETRRETKRPTAFLIGARVNPAAADLGWEVARTQQKIAAGAEFLVTDPVFDAALFERFVEAVGDSAVPILVGVAALRDFEHAEFLHYEAPGVTIPDAVLDRMRAAAGDPASVGREIAIEIVAAVRPLARGVVVAPEQRGSESTRILIGSLAHTYRSTRFTNGMTNSHLL